MHQNKKVKATITPKPESDRLFGLLFCFFSFPAQMTDNAGSFVFVFGFSFQKHSRNIIRTTKLAPERKLVLSYCGASLILGLF